MGQTAAAFSGLDCLPAPGRSLAGSGFLCPTSRRAEHGPPTRRGAVAPSEGWRFGVARLIGQLFCLADATITCTVSPPF